MGEKTSPSDIRQVARVLLLDFHVNHEHTDLVFTALLLLFPALERPEPADDRGSSSAASGHRRPGTVHGHH